MAQALEYAKQVMEQRQGLFGVATYDEIAWMYNLAVNAALKVGKYHDGDVFRQIARVASRVYRATKGNRIGREAWDYWYDIGPKALQAARNALAVIQVAGATR
jgi:hypothetical protein